MIHIKEAYPDEMTVKISIEGKLDRNSLPTLEEVCKRHLESDKQLKVVVQLDKLQGVGLKAKEYLKKLGTRAQLTNVPDFLAMELFDSV